MSALILTHYFLTIKNPSFQALDQQGNGTCSTLAFRHILKKYNIELTEEEFYHLVTYYDKNVNGRIPYNEFIGAHLE
jgi:Ca2+-binding EF-hand superfamily protein